MYYVHVVYTGQFPSLPFSTNIPFSVVGCHIASRPKKREEEGALHMNSEFPYPPPPKPAQPNPPFPFCCHRWKKGGEAFVVWSPLFPLLSSCANVTLLLLLRNHRFGPKSIGEKILNSKFSHFSFTVSMLNLDISQDWYSQKRFLFSPLFRCIS